MLHMYDMLLIVLKNEFDKIPFYLFIIVSLGVGASFSV